MMPVSHRAAAEGGFRTVTGLTMGRAVGVTFKSGPHPTCLVERSGDDTLLSVSFEPSLGAEGPLAVEIIVLADRSGSMSGRKMETLKNALQTLLRSLHSRTSFNIVSFGTQHVSLFERPVPLNEASFEQASRAVAAFSADMGGTNIREALIEVLASRSSAPQRSVLVITDGEVSDAKQLVSDVKASAGATRVFSVGIGSGSDEWLVVELAAAGNGTCEMVREGSRLESSIARIARRMIAPAVSACVVDFGALPVVTVAPARVPVAAEGEVVRFFALLRNDSANAVDGKHVVTLKLTLASGQVCTPVCCVMACGLTYICYQRTELQAPIDLAAVRTDSCAAFRLYARLLCNEAVGDAARKTATELAVRFNVVTRHTSMVAVDDNSTRSFGASPPVPVRIGDPSLSSAPAYAALSTQWTMDNNIERILNRSETIQELVDQASNLEMSSQVFYRNVSLSYFVCVCEGGG
jgi:hypothetical protein